MIHLKSQYSKVTKLNGIEVSESSKHTMKLIYAVHQKNNNKIFFASDNSILYIVEKYAII
jgi:hypothetical protein